MTQLSQDNILVYAEDEKKVKKGDGLKAVLALMVDLRDFQNSVKSCIENNELVGEVKAQIESFDEPILQMWKKLNKISEDGIRSIRQMEAPTGTPAGAPVAQPEGASKGQEASKPESALKTPHSPIMDENTIHKLP